MSHMKGKFIVLEGIDGAGTTTQLAKLTSYFSDKEGFHVFLTKEPTGFEIGKKIKENLKKDKAAGVDPFKEKGEEYAQLYVEDRIWHTKNIIVPLLEKGVHVVSDRYKYTTLSYQWAQGLEFNRLVEMHEGLIIPDLVILLDLPAEEALRRRVQSKSTPELFEKLEFQEECRKNYLAMVDKLDETIVVIDGSKSVEDVAGKIIQEVDKLWGKNEIQTQTFTK